MNGVVIFTIVISAVALLGRYALIERRRSEQHKKFMKDLENHDRKYKYKTK